MRRPAAAVLGALLAGAVAAGAADRSVLSGRRVKPGNLVRRVNAREETDPVPFR